MKPTKNFIYRFFCLLLLPTFISAFSKTIYAQKNDTDNEISLKDISEAVSVNGKPTLKILSRKKGGYTEVKLQKRDDENALVFDVVKSSMKNPVGKLFVTKTKVIFESFEKKDTNLSIEKSDIEKFAVKKSADGFPSLELDFSNDEAKFVIKFDRYQYQIDRASQKAAHNLLYRAIADFDSALKEFNELTKSAFPSEVEEK